MRRLPSLLPLLLLAAPAQAGRLERVLSQQGTLDKKDMTLPGGEWADVFPVDIAAGDRVIVEMESRKLDTYLVLKSPTGTVFENDDTGGERGFSQIDVFVEESGTWLVYATSAAAGEKGTYSLSVSVDSSGRGQAAATTSGGAQVLTPGQAVEGMLQAGDSTLTNGEWVDSYELALQAGQRLVLDMTSNSLDTYVGLRSPSGALDGNDDFEGNRSHSRIDRVVEESGTWTVFATTYQAGEGGPYTLSAQVGADAASSDGLQRWSGELAAGDAALSSGELVDAIKVRGSAGERWVVDLRSTSFDPFLIVKGPDGEQVENDDFEGASDRSLVDVTLGMDGEYTVAVTTYRAGESGSYDLTLRRVGADQATDGALSHSGTLESGDQVLGTGEWFDTYSFDALPGQQVQIDMRGDFDTYLGLVGPGGYQQENDDGEAAGHSRIAAVLPEAGTYKVVATSYQAGQGGRYSVEIALSQAEAGAAAQRDVAVLEPGSGAVGTLEAGDLTLDSGEYQDVYVLTASAGQDLAVSMSSTDFDPYVAIELPDGTYLQNDDWQGSNQLARVELTAPVTGRYRVFATSYRAGSTGNYRLDTELGSGAISVAAPVQPTGDGRIYGVFMGISDYPDGGPSDLDYTADDARQLHASMQAIGMRPQDGHLLVDSGATRAAFTAAVRQVASQMGPSDRMVLFYSGHGGRVDHQGAFQAADPDGYDETLALYDGEITDDEVAALLDGVTQGTVLLVFDSCFSGGFSKDVISRPGRMGLFSSHEDVTSAVARKFRAGGYLSRFMVEAIGERRADDGDGAITALELSQYLYERYRDDVKSMPQEKSGAYADIVMTGDNLGYQQIIVDRGGVGASQVLFAW